MAYNKSYNPDALPAHAEPEEVAQMISKMTVSGQSHASSHTQSYNQKRLPTRPPPQTVHSSGIPPRSSASSAPPQHAYAAAPSRFEHPHPHSHPHSHSHSGRSSSANGPPGQSLSQPQTQSRHHPLHPSRRPKITVLAPHQCTPSATDPRPHRGLPIACPPPLTAPSDDPQQLFPLFRAANASHSAWQRARKRDYTSFHPGTVRLMIRMFDRDGNGTINFDEFVSLWRYLAAWRELFDRFDEDRSGRVSQPEFEKALVAFGYRLSGKFISVIFGVFEGKAKQMSHAPKDSRLPGMGFDLFVQACISLKRMTDVFKRYDDDRDGYITLSFEEALTEILLLQE
ncbi:hypothetical protein PDIDSM_1482 [Penicillium digitatum]|nr:hypothetical protein PDIDSM_1482 [Penicillium digitatum]